MTNIRERINFSSVLLYFILFVASFAMGIVLTEVPSRKIATETIVQEELVPYTPTGDELVGEKININTADAQTLQMLDGIGEKLSERIVEYRTANGAFRTIENLMDVPGIGEAKFNDIKDKICAQ